MTGRRRRLIQLLMLVATLAGVAALIAPPAFSWRLGGACQTAAALEDADDDLSIFGNACANLSTFTESGVTWRIETFTSARPGPLFVLPHDNEDAALVTAAAALAAYGGAATAVETGGNRASGRIDPNRNFNVNALLCRMRGGSKNFTAAMLGPANRPIIALHTNARGAAGLGGTGTISIRAPYAGATAFPVEGADPDAMVILAAARGPDDRVIAALIRRLNAAGINVLVETVDLRRTDCSLSHYAVANGLPYANVEARAGDSATQRAILATLMPLL